MKQPSTCKVLLCAALLLSLSAASRAAAAMKEEKDGQKGQPTGGEDPFGSEGLASFFEALWRSTDGASSGPGLAVKNKTATGHDGSAEQSRHVTIGNSLRRNAGALTSPSPITFEFGALPTSTLGGHKTAPQTSSGLLVRGRDRRPKDDDWRRRRREGRGSSVVGKDERFSTRHDQRRSRSRDRLDHRRRSGSRSPTPPRQTESPLGGPSRPRQRAPRSHSEPRGQRSASPKLSRNYSHGRLSSMVS